jgi:hypothetical protein
MIKGPKLRLKVIAPSIAQKTLRELMAVQNVLVKIFQSSKHVFCRKKSRKIDELKLKSIILILLSVQQLEELVKKSQANHKKFKWCQMANGKRKAVYGNDIDKYGMWKNSYLAHYNLLKAPPSESQSGKIVRVLPLGSHKKRTVG